MHLTQLRQQANQPVASLQKQAEPLRQLILDEGCQGFHQWGKGFLSLAGGTACRQYGKPQPLRQG
ncbi:MAG: hypothetical protein M3380_12205, partial [Chloroflexota bacterium]|nr:hypothetical protein [Chloroflexota bacterium]